MIKIQFALICEIQRTGVLGKNDFLGVFDRIYVKSLPSAHPQLTFVVALYAETEDDLGKHNFALRGVAPNGRPLFEQQGVLEMRPQAGTRIAGHTLHFEFRGLPITELGRYWFRFDLDGKELTAVPLSVVQGPPPQPA